MRRSEETDIIDILDIEPAAQLPDMTCSAQVMPQPEPKLMQPSILDADDSAPNRVLDTKKAKDNDKATVRFFFLSYINS